MTEPGIPPALFPGGTISRDIKCMIRDCGRPVTHLLAYGCLQLHVYGASLCTACMVYVDSALAHGVCRCSRCGKPVADYAFTDWDGNKTYPENDSEYRSALVRRQQTCG